MALLVTDQGEVIRYVHQRDSSDSQNLVLKLYTSIPLLKRTFHQQTIITNHMMLPTPQGMVLQQLLVIQLAITTELKRIRLVISMVSF